MDNVTGAVTQSWFWQYFFAHFGWVDWGLAIFLLVGIFIGVRNGASRELPRLFETLISLFLTFEYYSFFADWLVRETPCPESYARVITFALLGFASWFLLRILFEIIGQFIHLEVASPFQMLGGVFVGGLRYFLFFSLVSYLLLLFPLDWLQQSYQVQSWSGREVVQIPVKIHEWLRGFFVTRAVV